MEISGMVCGTGGSNLPKPGDPDNTVTLHAAGIFSGIEISWTYPLTNPYAVAHTLLYRNTVNNYSTATEIAICSGNSYFDPSTSDTPPLYYYWIVIVSVNGTYGSPIGPASAIANGTIADIMTGLTDKIDRGVLAQSLKTQIDKITTLEDGLSAESSYRITDDTALATAFNGLQATMDSTVSLLLTETTARSTADTSLASQITTAQSQLGTDIASAQTTLQTNINTTNGHVTSIGALYTAKVTVNGLIGGFGVYNDGTSVEAGFDVDTFWIGRTGADKRKPFIVSDGVVYIDSAAIVSLDAGKITTGQMNAARVNTNGLIIRDNSGNVILGAGNALDASYAASGTLNSLLAGDISAAGLTAAWATVTGSGKPEDSATVGATFGVNLGGKIQASNIWSYIDTGVIGSAFIGDAAIVSAKIGTAEIGTLKVTGNAIGFSGSMVGGGGVGFHLNDAASLSCICYSGGTTDMGSYFGLVVDGGLAYTVSGPGITNSDGYTGTRGPATGVWQTYLGAGDHSVGFYHDNQAYDSARLLWVISMR